MFSFMASRILKFATKNSRAWLFIVLDIFSITSYLYFRPRCAGVDFYQLICTAKVASSYNFILFLFGLIVALVFNLVVRYITNKNGGKDKAG